MIAMLASARKLLRPRIGLSAVTLALLLGMVPASSAGAAQTSPPQAAASGDPIYMKIDSIPGESQSSKHKDEIEVSSFQWGLSRPVDLTTGQTTGKVKFNEFTIKKTIDKASPLFFQAAAEGTHIKTVIVYLNRGGAQQQDYMTITLSDVLVSGYSLSSGGDNPTESISFNYTKIEMSYSPAKPDGTLGAPIKAGWDVKSNLKI